MTMQAPGVATGLAVADWTADAEFHEYSRAANPIGSGHTPRIPMVRFGPELHVDRPTGVVALDNASALQIGAGPATTPALLASFIRITAGDELPTAPVATSELFHVLAGSGRSTIEGHGELAWGAGDFFTLPGGVPTVHRAEADATFLWVHDGPLLRHLGVAPATERFRPTHYPAERTRAELAAVAAAPRAHQRNRISVLLGNVTQPQTLTVTPTLWAMYGLLPAASEQAPHRHQSVAIDLITRCGEGCYTLVGSRVDDAGEIVEPTRVDWVQGGVFITPPGLWHAHHNDGDTDANLVPIQDAGLHTYLRSLDIRFSRPT
jgi:gentisate 1,2-dioxygenase